METHRRKRRISNSFFGGPAEKTKKENVENFIVLGRGKGDEEREEPKDKNERKNEKRTN